MNAGVDNSEPRRYPHLIVRLKQKQVKKIYFVCLVLCDSAVGGEGQELVELERLMGNQTKMYFNGNCCYSG